MNNKLLTFESEKQKKSRETWVDLVKKSPIPDNELHLNTGLFIIPQTLSRIIFLDFLYKSILDVQGSVLDLGCRWGQNMTIFSSLREIYEPFNRLRRIVGFDTFSGLSGCSDKDSIAYQDGWYASSQEHDLYLSKLLRCIEAEGPLAHIERSSVIKGDVRLTLPTYLDLHQETIVALAFFDMDIYEPTYAALQAIKPKLTKGSILAFDQLNDEPNPGETRALADAIGLQTYAIRRSPFNSRCSYIIIT